MHIFIDLEENWFASIYNSNTSFEIDRDPVTKQF